MASPLETAAQVVLGGGFFTGLAVLVRALARRGAGITDSAERTVILQERIIERQQHERERSDVEFEAKLDERDADLDRIRRERDKFRRQRDDARAVVRWYRRQHGEPTDPNLRALRVDGD